MPSAADFLGGFRPSRTRDRDMAAFAAAAQQLAGSWLWAAGGVACPELPPGGLGPLEVGSFVKQLRAAVDATCEAGRKLEEGGGGGGGGGVQDADVDRAAAAGAAVAALRQQLGECERAAAAARAPFAWADGPLVVALKRGEMMLVDELNLAGEGAWGGCEGR